MLVAVQLKFTMIYKEFEFEHASGEIIYFDLEYIVQPAAKGRNSESIEFQEPSYPACAEITQVLPRKEENPCFAAMWDLIRKEEDTTQPPSEGRQMLDKLEEEVTRQAVDRISTVLIRNWDMDQH